MQKPGRNLGDLIHRLEEGALVCFRRLAESADLSYELERSSSNLFGSDGGREVKERFDIPAHSNINVAESRSLSRVRSPFLANP